jgi:hypothetical protein
MKRFRIFSLILAVLLIFALSFTACDNDSTNGGGGNFANTNWRSSVGVMETRLSFVTSSDWAIYMAIGGIQWMAGNYKVSGDTATLWISNQEYGKATLSGNTLTLTGLAAVAGSSWTRETGDGGGNTSGNVAVISVSLNKSITNLVLDGTETLYAEIYPSNATNKNVTWSSNNTTVATVSTGGTVTALTAGSATITVSTVDGGKKANCSVTVTASTIPTFYDLEDFLVWLLTKPQNNKNNPYTVALNLNSLTGIYNQVVDGQYIDLDFSGSTFTSIDDGAFAHWSSLTSITIPNKSKMTHFTQLQS